MNTQLKNMATIPKIMKEESIHEYILFENMFLIKKQTSSSHETLHISGPVAKLLLEINKQNT